jgi:membrane-associated phospholipid phosphatase
MLRWSSGRRAQIVDFELMSRLGFYAGQDAGTRHVMTLCHLEVAPGAALNVPQAQYHPLVRLTRPSKAKFQKQAALVAQYADLRPDRATEIIAQLDGPEDFFTSIVYLHPDRTRWTWELLDAVSRLAQATEMRIKHALACRRPNEYSPQIQPMIQTPAHGALPSGHSTESFAAAVVLMRLLMASQNPIYLGQLRAIQLFRQAARVAINRQVAGVHFPVDSAAGAVLGMTLGEYLVGRFVGSAGFQGWSFEGHLYPSRLDFEWTRYYDTDPNSLGQRPVQPFVTHLGASRMGAGSPILEWLWGKAQNEWA